MTRRIACLLLPGLCSDVQAQDHGQIAGTVKDEQGAVLVGAVVRSTNVDTNLELVAVSGSNGACVITPVPVGFYDEGLGAIRMFSHTGKSSYNSLQASLDRRFSSGLGFGLSYTFSKSIDDTTTPYDAYNIVRALSDLDRPHPLNFNFMYELPLFKTRGGVVGAALGGWQVTGVTFVSSGVRCPSSTRPTSRASAAAASRSHGTSWEIPM
jgi:hypothetical protein